MSGYRIVWRDTNGSLRITVPVDPQRRNESDTDYLDRIAARTLAATPSLATCIREANVLATELPSREFRDCWRLINNSVKIDMALARGQKLSKLRALRNTKLQATDGLWMRAVERNDTVARQALEQHRQALRDGPVTWGVDLEALTTPEALQAYQPAVLN